MEQVVIRLVFAGYEIVVCVAPGVLVDVMDYRPIGEIAP
jgi:hypothetical protein